jgi:iron complex outermembrane recepter protein
MNGIIKYLLVGCGSYGAMLLATQSASAEATAGAPSEASSPASSAATGSPDSGPNVALDEIVVTAQKRSEPINKVGMSITAITGDVLAQISSPEDVAKLVPGLTFSTTGKDTPVFYIRGVGFDEATLGANPSVALYSDQVPLAFPVEARFATFDLERVEVLKGPQGLLYGQNSTGGAINFISAKPTDQFESGFDGSFGNFNSITTSGFISGPITDTLQGRVALMDESGGDWQRSYTRDAYLGAKRNLAGRITLDWKPTDRFKAILTINGWVDNSDTLASQLIGVDYEVKSVAVPPLSAYPLAPFNATAADWEPNPPGALRRDDYFVQPAVTLTYDVTNAITLTSISSYSDYKQNFWQDADGTDLNIETYHQIGSIQSLSQELRLNGTSGPVQWIVGGDYTHNDADDRDNYYFGGSSAATELGITASDGSMDQSAKSDAVFANADWSVTSELKFTGGLRYTHDSRQGDGCVFDPGNGDLSALYSVIVSAINGRPITVPPGACITIQPNYLPGLTHVSLTQDNVSWRGGAEWTPELGSLLWANISRGFKAGSIPNLNASTYAQYKPVPQESVLAYQAGLKQDLFDRRAHIDLSGYYYNYSDKQLLGYTVDPLGIFGTLPTLVSVPKSRVWGFEAASSFRLSSELSVGASAAYINSKVLGNYSNYDPLGNTISFSGQSFPQAPKWNLSGDVNYNKNISSNMEFFAASQVTYRSQTQSAFNDPAVTGAVAGDPLNPATHLSPDLFEIREYINADAQIGIGKPGAWRASLWARNLLDRYQWSGVAVSLDTIYRLPMMPRTYGFSFSLRY